MAEMAALSAIWPAYMALLDNSQTELEELRGELRAAGIEL